MLTQLSYCAAWSTQQGAAPQSQEEPRKFFNETSYPGLQQGQPAPVVQGMQHGGPINTGETLFCPASQDGPTFLGATGCLAMATASTLTPWSTVYACVFLNIILCKCCLLRTAFQYIAFLH